MAFIIEKSIGNSCTDYEIVVEWLFIHIILVSYILGCTKAGDASMWYKRSVVIVKEVQLIGYGHRYLVIVKQKCGVQLLQVINEKNGEHILNLI